MATELGLRERKKKRTRLAIADVATGLFIERGFEAVTLAEIARAAEVSVNTIFNYFGSKEDLFFDRQGDIEGHWARVVVSRQTGESAVAALRREYFAALDRRDLSSGLVEGLADFARAIVASPALLAREREIGERGETALAIALAEETGAAAEDPAPRLAAAQLVGVLRALQAESRRGLLAGETPEVIAPGLRRAAEGAFAQLERALGDYAVRHDTDPSR